MIKYETINGSSIYQENLHFQLINCFEITKMLNSREKDFLSYHSLNMDNERLKNTNIFICGLDLLTIQEIREFFSINSKVLYLFNFVCYLFSVDCSAKNHNPTINQKKLFASAFFCAC